MRAQVSKHSWAFNHSVIVIELNMCYHKDILYRPDSYPRLAASSLCRFITLSVIIRHSFLVLTFPRANYVIVHVAPVPFPRVEACMPSIRVVELPRCFV